MTVNFKTLKQKALSGLLWSFIDNIANYGVTFIFGIILARLLSPKEFGLIGMLTIFMAISQSFIDSGFRQALIRKQNCTIKDYSTVFYFNVFVGVLFYLLLFVIAGVISGFYHEPILRNLMRVLGLSLIINSFSLIQTILLAKNLKFRLQAKISVIASFISGFISISLAYSGWGVWSLVVLAITKNLINLLLLWIWSTWKPTGHFSRESFRELFSFGSKLLVSGLIDTLYRNINYLVIGRYFTAVELGYYARADQFQSMPSSNLQVIIGRVSYPVLSTIQDDLPKLRKAYIRILRSTMLITFILMLGMAAIARPMVLTLIGVKWEPCIIYLQMLIFVGMFFPLQAINMNMLQLKGRSDLILRLEIFKKALAIPIIMVGIVWGIKAMIFGMVANSIIAYYMNSYWSGRFINYSILAQIKDILPSFLLAAFMSSVVFIEGVAMNFDPLVMLVIQLTTGAILTVGICEVFNLKDYLYIKQMVRDSILKSN